VPFVPRPSACRSPRSPRASWPARRWPSFNLTTKRRAANHVAVKEAVFPFARFPGVDTMLGPEMRSTGEVMGLDRDFAMAFAKSQLGAGVNLPTPARSSSRSATATSRHSWSSHAAAAAWASASSPPAAPRPPARAGPAVDHVNKVLEGRPHIVDAMLSGEVQLVFNTTEGAARIREPGRRDTSD
jgi:carbamoyl-phosphate synthase large subunit